MLDKDPLALHSFSFAGKVLIWSGRRWNGHRRDWPNVEDEFSGPFGTHTGQALAAALDDLFCLLKARSVRPMVFGTPNSRHIQRDEALIVELIQMEQRHQSSLVISRLEQILPRDAARHAIAIVATIAHLLEQAGYDVSVSTNGAPAARPRKEIWIDGCAHTIH